MDVLPGFIKGLPAKAALDIADVGDEVPADDAHEGVILADFHLVAIPAVGLPGWRGLFTPQLRESLVSLDFGHRLFRWEQRGKPGIGRSRFRAVWRSIPVAFVCSAFSEARFEA